MFRLKKYALLLSRLLNAKHLSKRDLILFYILFKNLLLRFFVKFSPIPRNFGISGNSLADLILLRLQLIRDLFIRYIRCLDLSVRCCVGV